MWRWLGKPFVCNIQVDQSDLLLAIKPAGGFSFAQEASLASCHHNVVSCYSPQCLTELLPKQVWSKTGITKKAFGVVFFFLENAVQFWYSSFQLTGTSSFWSSSVVFKSSVEQKLLALLPPASLHKKLMENWWNERKMNGKLRATENTANWSLERWIS